MKRGKTPILLRIVQWIFPRLEKTLPSLANRFFVTIFFSPLNYSVPAKEKMIEREAKKFGIMAAGKRIQCYEWGAGPVVLLIHGWAGRATQFRKIITALVSEGFCVIGFDGPAHGRSQGTSTNIIEFEDALRKIYEHAGKPVGIIAHSFGGGAALYAAMNGLPIEKLINIASPTIGDEIINTYLKTIGGSKQTGEAFKEYILRHTGKPFDEFTALHFVRHLPQRPRLLLVHDEHDPEVPLRHAHELLKLYPEAGLMITQGLGHTRILRDADVIGRCLSFLKS